MPLPKPNENEKKPEWIERCMDNDAMKEEFPDNDQRLAVCHARWNGEHSGGLLKARLLTTVAMTPTWKSETTRG